MILLDTNILIDLISEQSVMFSTVEKLITSNNRLCTSSICWAEFLTGPVLREHIASISNLIEDRILNFGKKEATLAAEIYNTTGRTRGTRIDSLIAASAISNSAELLTLNKNDFLKFQEVGLELL